MLIMSEYKKLEHFNHW